MRYCGCMVEMDVKVYSPMLSDFKVVSKGDPAKKKKKMYWMSDLDLTKEQLASPIIKNSKKKKLKSRKQVLDLHLANNYTAHYVDDPLLDSDAE